MALVTAMVFLIILSVIGITGMRNTVLEQKMSSNMQDLNHAFQLAESGIVRAASDSRMSNTENSRTDPVTLSYTSIYDSSDERITLVAETYYRGKRIIKGDIEGTINSNSTTLELIFDVRAVGRYNDASSAHTQGFAVLAPKQQ